MTVSKPNITALVINLARSTERMAFQENQLIRLGIAFERIAATSTSDIPQVIYEQHANDWERKMRPTEVACFMSHLNAWKHVVESQKAHLILEDDALLANNCAELLTELHTNPLQADVVTLEVRARKKLVSKKQYNLTSEYHALRLYQDRTGAASYILYPAGAQKLLNAFDKNGMALADAFIANNYNLLSYQVEPAACIQLDMCEHYGIPSRMQMTSTIATTVADKPVANNNADERAFKWRRLMSQLKMAVRFLSTCIKAKRRPVSINHASFNNK